MITIFDAPISISQDAKFLPYDVAHVGLYQCETNTASQMTWLYNDTTKEFKSMSVKSDYCADLPPRVFHLPVLYLLYPAL